MPPRRIRGKKFFSKYGVKPPAPKINLKKEIIYAVGLPLLFIPVISLFICWEVISYNKKRQQVKENRAMCAGVITFNVRSGRGSHYASYKFNLDGKTFDGKTFYEYTGQIGDAVKVMYNAGDPEKNIIADEAPEESMSEVFNHRVVPVAFILSGAVVVYIILVFIFAQREKRELKSRL